MTITQNDNCYLILKEVKKLRKVYEKPECKMFSFLAEDVMADSYVDGGEVEAFGLSSEKDS